MIPLSIKAAIAIVAVLGSIARPFVGAATCNSQDVTDPKSLRSGSVGWSEADIGAGGRRQGHVSEEVTAWGRRYLVMYGGTSVRNDDVNDVVGRESTVSILDVLNPRNWTELEMVAYDGSPPPLFRPGSFVWSSSLFLVAGHTDEPYTATNKVWRADVQGFAEADAPEGLWRPINASKEDVQGGQVSNIPRYGHSAVVLNTGGPNADEVWVAVIGGMTGSQNSINNDLILYLHESADTFACDDQDLNVTSTLTCAERTHVRPTETEGEWWQLAPRLLSTASGDVPGSRAYHAAASLASDGTGASSCLYIFGGRDYEKSVLYSDLWRLCPVSGHLGDSVNTTFEWTEISPRGDLPKGRYGATFTAGMEETPNRILLYGGTGRYPNTYMADDFTREYDAYLNAWVDSFLENGSSMYPVGRRDHTMNRVRESFVMIAGINNDEEALRDLWSVNYSSPTCEAGKYMFFCDTTAAPVCGVCPDGTATESASYTCQTCTSGFFAQAGSAECEPCPAGKYGTGDAGVEESTACSDCPAGTSTTNGVGTPSVDGCIECEPGTYSLQGALICSPCPSGFYSGTGASECIPCAAGTFRQIYSSSGDCDPCSAGTYAPFEQASECLDCPRGFFSEAGGATACNPCPAGTAAAAAAAGDEADSCHDCGPGEYAAEDGSTACEPCPAGTASATIGADNDGVCQICPIGTFAASKASVCQKCRSGEYNAASGKEACDLCPLGTFVGSTGSTSPDDCLSCPMGSTTNTSGAVSSADCNPCAPGTRSVALEDGGGCKFDWSSTSTCCGRHASGQECPRGESTPTFEAAQALNCTQCAGGFYADSIGTGICPACEEGELSYNGHATCSACISNTSCPLGPNGEACSGLGSCDVGVCVCSDGFDNVDCSSGTCDGCFGVFGFDFASSVVTAAESAGTVSLTLVRLAGTDHEVTVTLDVVRGNATASLDFGGTWPRQVVFPSGQTESALSVGISHDSEPNEGCESFTVGIAAVSGAGSAVVHGGIHDASAEATVYIEEDDFTSAILEVASAGALTLGGGGLIPATAEVVIADASATWASNVTLSLVGTTPSNRSASFPPDILLLLESDSTLSTDLGRLAALMPGLAAQMQARHASTSFGVASFATAGSSYDYDLLQPLTTLVHPISTAVEETAADSASRSEAPPSAQVASLFEAAEDSVNESGWSDDVFRVAAVVTGSHFAEATGFDRTDASTWVLPHGVTLSQLRSRLSSAAVHPLFLVMDETLLDEYEALVGELGFGAARAIEESAAIAEGYNGAYLRHAIEKGLEALYAQAALVIQADDGGFVASVTPPPDAVRNETAGAEVKFMVNMSSTPSSALGSGVVNLSFQGHKTTIAVVRKYTSCEASQRSRTSGTDIAASDASRAGWLQGFHTDEETKWVMGPLFSVGNESAGPFGVSQRVMTVSCPEGCSEGEAYQDVTLSIDSELPIVLKAYFYLYAGSVATSAFASLYITYIGDSQRQEVSTLDFPLTQGMWTQAVEAVYPTDVITTATVKLSFSGTGEAAFAGMGLFAHPDVACRCGAGYYLDIGSAPARSCTPKPECTYYEGWCVYCPAGFKCPQGGVLTACLDGEYSMGGYTECFPCPAGWLCSQGLAVPCGYGTSLSRKTTVVQEEEGSSASSAGVYGGRCMDCPAGHACPGLGLYEECAPGMFAPGDGASNMCMPCAPGTFAEGTANAACEKCSAGYTSHYGATECFPCEPGFVSQAGQHPCEPCDAGSYAVDGDPACTPCAIGFFADDVGMWTCTKCPAGMSTHATGSTSSIDCLR